MENACIQFHSGFFGWLCLQLSLVTMQVQAQIESHGKIHIFKQKMLNISYACVKASEYVAVELTVKITK
jgi:hypothetical protein